MQRAVEKGLKVPCLFMITEVSICCQKNLEVAIRRIPAYTPPIHHRWYGLIILSTYRSCCCPVQFQWAPRFHIYATQQ